MKNIIRSITVKIFRSIQLYSGYCPPEIIFKHLHFRGPFNVKLPSGQDVTLYSWGDRVENELAWRGWDGHEPDERRCWAAMVAKGGDILDIGANTATFALFAKALSPDSRVFAFEPLKRIAEKAKKNAETAGLDITVICAALARQQGYLPIHDPGGENAYSASLDAHFLPGKKEAYMVPVLSIDEFCLENDLDPTAIKLDVEGYEGDVICGATEILKRGRCIFLCEWIKTSKSHEEAQKLLAENGYVALDVRNFSKIELSENKKSNLMNIMLIHKSRVQEIMNLMKT